VVKRSTTTTGYPTRAARTVTRPQNLVQTADSLFSRAQCTNHSQRRWARFGRSSALRCNCRANQQIARHPPSTATDTATSGQTDASGCISLRELRYEQT
jgi:hypothetical protein